VFDHDSRASDFRDCPDYRKMYKKSLGLTPFRRPS
jgi:hypothetical protein